ncbi:hypothetical protein Tco_1048995 [Tanacetum coccineum]
MLTDRQLLTSTASEVNTVSPFVNGIRPTNVFLKTHSQSSRPFKRTTVQRTSFSNQKVYTVKVKEVSTVGGKWDTAVKSSQVCTCRVQRINLADFQDLMMALLPLEEVKGDITGKGKIKLENQANLHAGQQESNQNTGTKDKIDAGDSEKEIGGTKKRMNKFFRLILQRLQRQEMEANGGSEALMKTLVTRNSELGYSGRAAMSISTASANERLSLSETTNSQKDDNEIPPLDGYSEVDTDGIFTIQLMLFLDLSISEKVYKVVKALYGCIKLPRAWYATDNPQQEMSIYWQERTLTWHAKSRPLWPTSTTDAEYVALLHMLLLGKFYDSKSMLDYGSTSYERFQSLLSQLEIHGAGVSTEDANQKFAIRHHFIRDAYEKKLIQVLKIHTDDNVADLLTKAFDVSRFQFLVVSIGMINP